MESSHSNSQSLPGHVPVLVVGGGPAGMIAALQLSRNKIPCLLVERNLDTTRWPKMDITNCRSMELLKRLGVDEGLREVGMYSHDMNYSEPCSVRSTLLTTTRAGVPDNFSFDVLFSTGLSDDGKFIAKWV